MESLLEAIRRFSETRRTTPVVRVTLDYSGEEFFVHEAAAGPGDDLVSLSVYGGKREREMIRREDDDPKSGGLLVYFTHRLVLIDPARIAKVDLLYEAPNAVPFGFRPPE